MQTIGQCKIDIYYEDSFKKGSADNVNKYDFEYFDESEYMYPTMFGIKVFKDEYLFKSAIIGSIGGGTTNHVKSTIFENERFLICCSDTVFCLSIPDLNLLWRTQADQASCFEIFKYKDNYIIHGEFEITRLDKNGVILWQHSGADIFTTINGKDDFELTDKYIIAKDFENRIYKFDYNGTDFTDMKQFVIK